MSSMELIQIPVKPGAYEKPERTNNNIPAKKYDRIDEVCQKKVFLSNDGNAYVPQDSMNVIFNTTRSSGQYIYDNILDDEDKRVINGINAVKSSSVVGELDKRSHELREADKADLHRYARDSLLGIGDSDQAEGIRRRLDTHTSKELTRLKKQRGVQNDEITGEPLKKNSAFHHLKPKAIFTDPVAVLDETKGINVNFDTHAEIHKRNIRSEAELERNIESIRSALRG